MPIIFKNAPTPHPAPASTKSFDGMADIVRAQLQLPEDAVISVGVSRTVVNYSGIHFEIPFGIQHVKNGSPKLTQAHTALSSIVAGGNPPPPEKAPTAPAIPLSATEVDSLDDEKWVEHVAGQLFPGTIHLYSCNELYQPVLGTGTGSIYKSCFIGPELKVASRIKNGTVSFRATTNMDTCPDGMIAKVIERLGVTQKHTNRLTCHAAMTGNYTMDNAHEYRALFGAFYAALKPWITSNFPNIQKLTEGVK